MRRFCFQPYPLLAWAAGIAIASATVPLLDAGAAFTAILGTPVALLLCFLWPARWRTSIPTRITTVVAFVVVISVAMTSWPLKLEFLIARPTLDSLATQVEAGHKVKVPLRVGLLTIKKVEIDRSGVVCLWITVDTDGDMGIVRTTAEKVDKQFNLWDGTSLSRDWQLIQED